MSSLRTWSAGGPPGRPGGGVRAAWQGRTGCRQRPNQEPSPGSYRPFRGSRTHGGASGSSGPGRRFRRGRRFGTQHGARTSISVGGKDLGPLVGQGRQSRQGQPGFAFSQCRSQFGAAGFGHVDVQHQHIRPEFRQALQRLQGLIDPLPFHPCPPQHGGLRLPPQQLLVPQQHAIGLTCPPGRPAGSR